MVAEGQFREDLYYRLNVLQIRLPALRERHEDLPALLGYFIEGEALRLGLGTQFALDPAAEEVLLRYVWPGNMRELQNVMARALVLADDGYILISDLPDHVSRGEPPNAQELSGGNEVGNLRVRVREFEQGLIKDAIDRSGGDRQHAARCLGIGLSTLYRKLEDMSG